MTDNPRGAKQQLTFRVQPQTLSQLKQRAKETGRTQTELAERYVEEGLRMDEHPLVVFRDGATGRRPGLVGSSTTLNCGCRAESLSATSARTAQARPR